MVDTAGLIRGYSRTDWGIQVVENHDDLRRQGALCQMACVSEEHVL
ncbi:MAG: hypothetical protein J1E01_03825 [Acetatifactor sp.]|nr:hypothetical protein [Acetatifactor sp.]